MTHNNTCFTTDIFEEKLYTEQDKLYKIKYYATHRFFCGQCFNVFTLRFVKLNTNKTFNNITYYTITCYNHNKKKYVLNNHSYLRKSYKQYKR